jgi:hypothetical protein
VLQNSVVHWPVLVLCSWEYQVSKIGPWVNSRMIPQNRMQYVIFAFVLVNYSPSVLQLGAVFSKRLTVSLDEP